MKRILRLLFLTNIVAVLILLGQACLYPVLSAAEAGEINMETVSGDGAGYTYLDSVVTITQDGSYILTGTGTETANRIVVNGGVTADITINNVNINSGSGAFVMTGATVNLTLSGSNTLRSGSGFAGLQVCSGTLTITQASTGNLTVYGGYNSAGIGAPDRVRPNTGTIIIEGGTVNANGGTYGAGIGGGLYSEYGVIIIRGGSITANGTTSAAGLGGGDYNYPGTINIEGGTVTANGGYNGAGIGGGCDGVGGIINILGGTVNANAGTNGAGIGCGRGGSPRRAAGGTVTVSGGNIVVNARGSGSGKDIGSGDNYDQTIRDGGTLTVDDSATVNLNATGTDAQTDFITCTISGGGAGLHSGTYLNGHKKITLSSFTVLPNSQANALDNITFSVNVNGLSYTDPQGSISFKANGAEIANAPITREGVVAAGTAGISKSDVPGGSYTFTAEYVQDSVDSYYTADVLQITGYTVNKLNQALLLSGIPDTVTYGDAAFDINVSSESTGELSFSVTSGNAVTVNESGTVTVQGAGTVEITVTKAGDDYYNGASATVSIVVNKAIPEAVIFPVASLTYGQSLGEAVLTGAAGDGSFVWEDAAAVPPVQNAGYQMVFTPADSVNFDYSGVVLQQTLTTIVEKKDLTIKAADKTKVYGESDPLFTESYTGFVNGEDKSSLTGILALTRQEGENAGTYTITPSGLTSANYNIIYQTGQLEITPTALTIAADAESKIYGEPDPELTYVITAGTLLGADGITGALTRIPGENSGTYMIEQGTLTAGINYDITYTGANLTINKKALTIRAEDMSKVYGAADPAYTISCDGFIAGEDESALLGTLAFNRAGGEDVGEYTITPSGLTSLNYEITYETGALTINKKALALRAEDKSKVYGAADPVFTVSYDGFITGEDDNVLDGILALTRQEGENAGTYTITPSGLTSANYNIIYQTGQLEITPIALTITADAGSKIYGEPDPELTYVITAGALLGADGITGALARTPGENSGTYMIEQGTLSAGINYDITYAGAVLTITKKPLTIRAGDKSKVYGAADPAYTIVCDGFIAGEDESDLLGTLVFNRVEGEDASAYTITPSGLTSVNYEITYETGIMTINKKPLIIRAEDKRKAYGEAEPAFTVIYDGFITGEDEENLSGTLALDRAEGEEAGTYTITPSGLSSNNYDITFIPGTLRILSTNAHLSGLSLSNPLNLNNLTFSPAFDSGITNYIAGVANRVGSITVTLMAEDSNASISINGLSVSTGQASDDIILNTGLNIINVMVTAEDEVTTKTYLVTINRSHGGSSTIPQPEPEPVAEISEQLTGGTFDSATGNVSASVDDRLLEYLFGKAEADEGARKTIRLVIPEVEAASSYTLEASVTGLSSTGTDKEMLLTTPLGTIGIPDDMLTGSEDAAGEKAAITIGRGDKASMSADVKAALGDRPLVQLSLTIDGRQVAWNNPDAPVTVSIPYTPTAAEQQDLEHIVVWYIDGSGKAVSVPSGRYDPETGCVTFTTTHFSNYAVAFVYKTFGDLSCVEWARKPIEVMASKGIINGTGADTYLPAANITRADYLVLLVKTLGLTADFDGNFSDVASGTYYYEAVGIAKELGITAGSGRNRFSPNEKISRQDMMVLTARALEESKGLKILGDSTVLDQFSDKNDIAGYSAESLAALVSEGLITGSGDKLNPRANTIRAEAAVFLYRIYTDRFSNR